MATLSRTIGLDHLLTPRARLARRQSVIQIKRANIWIFYFRRGGRWGTVRRRVLLPIRWPASLIRFVINTSAAVGAGKLPLHGIMAKTRKPTWK